jgi:hypothetical protein
MGGDTWSVIVAKTNTEQIDDLWKEVAELRTDVAIQHERIGVILRDFRESQAERKTELNDVKELRQEFELLRQRLDDHLKRMDLWGGRLWAFILALVGAVLSLAAGLIVTLAKK